MRPRGCRARGSGEVAPYRRPFHQRVAASRERCLTAAHCRALSTVSAKLLAAPSMASAFGPKKATARSMAAASQRPPTLPSR